MQEHDLVASDHAQRRMLVGLAVLAVAVAGGCGLLAATLDSDSAPARILATSVVLLGASLAALPSLSRIGRVSEVPLVAAGLIVVAAGLTLAAVWIEARHPPYWKFAIVAWLMAGATSHLGAVISVNLSPGFDWVRVIAASSMWLLVLVAAQIVGGVDVGRGGWMAVGILAWLAACFTAMVPLAGRLSRKRKGMPG